MSSVTNKKRCKVFSLTPANTVSRNDFPGSALPTANAVSPRRKEVIKLRGACPGIRSCRDTVCQPEVCAGVSRGLIARKAERPDNVIRLCRVTFHPPKDESGPIAGITTRPATLSNLQHRYLTQHVLCNCYMSDRQLLPKGHRLLAVGHSIDFGHGCCFDSTAVKAASCVASATMTASERQGGQSGIVSD